MELKAVKVNVGYNEKKSVLRDLSFTLNNGLTGLIGTNGSGKSTLLKSLAGLTPLLDGELYFNQQKLPIESVNDLSKLISVVLTEKVDVPYMTVNELVSSGRSPYTNINGKMTNNDSVIIDEYMELCELVHLRNKYVSEISDGERQRIMIARALTQDTPIVLLDEPTSFLDFRSRYEIMELLKKISASSNKLILFSSHDLELVFQLTDFCMVITEDKTLTKHTTDDLLQSGIPEQLLSGTNLYFDISKRKIFYNS